MGLGFLGEIGVVLDGVGWRGRRVLVAVSGGADSVALLRSVVELSRAASVGVAVAHFNHGWRGEASDGDERFVRGLCSRLGVPFLLGRAGESGAASSLGWRGVNCGGQFDFGVVARGDREECRADRIEGSRRDYDREASESTGGSKSTGNSEEVGVSGSFVIEDGNCLHREDPQREDPQLEELRSESLARQDRYRFLTKAAYEWGAGYVLTGHTANDRAETLLHNLLRGAGLAGLASLRLHRGLDSDLVLLRPMLGLTRADVLLYLQQLGQDFRSDATNESSDYTLNFLRNQVLPLAQAAYQHDITRSLVSCSEVLEETLVCIEVLARRWLQKATKESKSLSAADLKKVGALASCERMEWIAELDRNELPPWPVLREGLRLLWIERGWPLQEMNRFHWERLNEWITASTRGAGRDSWITLGTLPGAIRCHAKDDWFVLTR